MADDSDTLILSISADVRQVKKALERLGVDMKTMAKGMEGSLAGIDAAANKTAASINKIDKSVTDAGRTMKTFSTTLKSSLAGLGVGFGVSFGVQQVQQILDANTKITNSLKVAGLQGDKLTEVYDKLANSASKFGAPFESLAKVYSRVAIVQNELGVSTEQLTQFTDNVAAALKVQGISAADAQGPMLQLSQLLSTGTVRAEEFNSVNEGLPIILKTVAIGMFGVNGSIVELQHKMKAGELTSKDFFDAYEKGSEMMLQGKAAKAATTLGQAMENVRTQLIRTFGDFDTATGTSAELAKNINLIAEAIRELGLAMTAAAESPVGDFIAFVHQAVDELVKASGRLGKVTGLENVGKALGATPVEQDKIAPYFEFINKTIASTSTAVEKLQAQMGDLDGTHLTSFGAQWIAIAQRAQSGTLTVQEVEAAIAELEATAAQWPDMPGLEKYREALKSMLPLLDSARFGINKAQQAIDAAPGPGGGPVTPKLDDDLLKAYEKSMDHLRDSTVGDLTDMDKAMIQFMESLAAAQTEAQRLAATDLFNKRVTQINENLNVEHVKDFGDAMSKLRDITGDSMDAITKATGAYFEALKLTQSEWEKTAAAEAFNAVIAKINDNMDANHVKDFQDALDRLRGTGVNAMTEMQKATADYIAALNKATNASERLQAASSFQFRSGQIADLELGQMTSGTVNNYVDQVVTAESGGAANAKNPNSSATGVGQFIASTWLDVFKRTWPAQAARMNDAQILELRKNSDVSRKLVQAYADENTKLLSQAGVAVSDVALHLAHFLGPGGAIAVLKRAQRGEMNAPVSGFLSQEAIAANPTVLGGGATVADVLRYGQGRVTAGTKQPKEKAVPHAQDFESFIRQTQEATDKAKAEREAIDGVTVSIDQETYARERAGYIAEGMAAARRDGTEATKEEEAAIIKVAEARAYEAAAIEGAKNASKDLAAQQKLTEQTVAEFAGMAKDFLGGFISDLRQGKTASEALANAISRLTDRLIDMALNAVFDPKNLMSLLGMGGGAASFVPNTTLTSVLGMERGGIVGRDGSRRRVDQRVFRGARSMASGGMVLKSGEVPIIAHRGELVIPKGMTRNAGSVGGDVTNNIGDVTVDMSQTGLVASTTETGKLLGRQIQTAVQFVLVRESRPGGILRKQGTM